jgi:hypothetical protein
MAFAVKTEYLTVLLAERVIGWVVTPSRFLTTNRTILYDLDEVRSLVRAGRVDVGEGRTSWR